MKGVIYARYSSDNQREESIEEQILCVLERFRSLDLSIERNIEQLVDALVKCIVLYDDKLIITVTFRDEPIVIMTSKEFADVARLGSDIESLAPPKAPLRWLR